MFCSKCGNNLSENAKFCPKCGAKVPNRSEAESREGKNVINPAAEQRKVLAKDIKSAEVKKGSMVPIIAIIAMIVVVAFVFVGFFVVKNVIGSMVGETADRIAMESDEEDDKKASSDKVETETSKEDGSEAYPDEKTNLEKLEDYAEDLISIAGNKGTVYLTSNSSGVQKIKTDVGSGNIGYYLDSYAEMLVTADYEDEEKNRIRLKTYGVDSNGTVKELDNYTYDELPEVIKGDTGKVSIYKWDIDPAGDSNSNSVMHFGIEERSLYCTGADGVYYLLDIFSVGEDGEITLEFEKSMAGSDVSLEDFGDDLRNYMGNSRYDNRMYYNSFCSNELMDESGDDTETLGVIENVSEAYKIQNAGRYEEAGDISMKASGQVGSGVEDYPWSRLRIKGTNDVTGGGYDDYFDNTVSYDTEETDLYDSEYIIPDSGIRMLSLSDLEPLSAEELRLARNEIYARHGRKFKDKALQDYFDGKSWYVGQIEPDDFTDDMLSDIERENKNLIADYEKSLSK